MAELLDARGAIGVTGAPGFKGVTLSDYLRTCALQTWKWGERDCALFVADWVRIATGRDGAAALRGQYASEAGAEGHIGPRGLADLVGDCCAMIGIYRVAQTVPGDIAVIERAGRQVCAIRVADGWVMRDRRGLMRTPHVDVVAAWRVQV